MARIGIVLAGGLGKRMNSHLPKPAIQIGQKSMLQHVLDKLEKIGLEKFYVVYGQKGDLLKESVSPNNKIVWVHQDPQLGTGHAVQVAVKNIVEEDATVLICNGDAPFVLSETMSKLLDKNSLLTCKVKDPKGYGRIIMEDCVFKRIVEEKDATEEERKIKTINAGVYAFDLELLRKNIFNLNNENAQQEYYLTDLLEILVKQDININVVEIDDEDEIYNVNNPDQLEYAKKIVDRFT